MSQLRAGPTANGEAPPTAPDKTKGKPSGMDSVLGNVGLGTKAFEPPFTRDKYLEYFRSIAYGDASLRKHGGNRRVDIQMAAELSHLYAQHASVRASVRSVVEDDVRLLLLRITAASVVASMLARST